LRHFDAESWSLSIARRVNPFQINSVAGLFLRGGLRLRMGLQKSTGDAQEIS
jgi:hypothetical protein